MTDQGVTLPGGNGATNGESTVTAHTLSTGTGSNIAASDINGPCCLAYILAKNSTAFSGGVDARSYPMVTQTDIEQTANTLKESLESRVQGDFSTELQSGEARTSPQCQPTVSSTHKAGDEATHVRITVALFCLASAYNTEQLQQALHFELYLYGAEQLNSYYQQRGVATITALSSKAEGDQVTLTVKARASYTYQFTETLFEMYKQAIAGKSKGDAGAWLEQQSGVDSVTLAIEEGERLPTTPSNINLVVIQKGGE